jgi:hypothetical protein
MPADHIPRISLPVKHLVKIGDVKVERRFIETGDHIHPGKKGIEQVFLQQAGWPD